MALAVPVQRGWLAARLAATVALTAFAQPAAAAPPADLEAYVERLLDRYGGAGIAVAIVEGDAIIHARGYGRARLAPDVPAHADTLFPIGSNTKAMTAMLLARQVDAGLLGWDDRVEDRLPGFRMHDPHVSREIRVRDLLSHRSGLGAGQGDLLFWPETRYPTAELVRRVGLLRPEHGFRATFAYNNMMVMVSGEVSAQTAGLPWAELVRRDIFEPLGMTRTFVSPERKAPAHVQLASLYLPRGNRSGRTLDLVTQPVHFPNAAATGGVWSTASDMGRWLCAVLASAREEAPSRCPRLTSHRQMREMWSAHTPMPLPSKRESAADAARPTHLSYGLGWQIRDWRGQPLRMHGGTVVGGISMVAVLPEQQVAFAILTNTHDRRIPNAIGYRLLDHYTGNAAPDWIALLEAEHGGPSVGPEPAADPAIARRPHLPLAAYAGTYRDPWFGDLVVRFANGGLYAEAPMAPRLAGPLRHVGADSFRADWRSNGTPDALISFQVDANEKVTGAAIAAPRGWANDPYRGLAFQRRD